MKRTLALILALFMLLTVLAGCGTKTTDPQEPKESASANAATDAPEQPGEDSTPEPEPTEEPTGVVYPLAETVTLTAFNGIYQPRTGDKIESWDESLPYVTAAEATNIYIDMECCASNAQKEQTMLMVNGGDYPDLWSNMLMYYPSADQLISDEICMDVSPYLEEYAPDYMAAIREGGYEKDIKADSGVSVALYHIVKGQATNGMMIRKDWLDDLNLEVPVTYDDYGPILEAFKVEKGAVEAYALDGTSCGASDVFNAGFGVQLYSHPIQGSGNDGFYQVDGKVKFGYLEEGFVEYITLMHEWFDKGYISPDYVVENENNSDANYIAKIVTGEIGVVTNGRNNLEIVIDSGTDADPNFNMIPINAPVKNKGDKLHLAPYRQSSLSAGFYLSTTCSNPEAAVMWHNYWFTEEGHMVSNYGVEGLTYEMKDGKPVYTDYFLNNPDGLTINQTSYFMVGQLGVVDNSREEQWYSPLVIESARIWGENVDNEWKIPGATSMTADESNKYNATFADIKTYISECLPKFVMGEMSLDEMDAFQSKLVDMGINECMDIWQTALDRYNKR